MASQPHHCQHSLTSGGGCCSCCNHYCCTQHHHPPQSSPTHELAIDPLLQSLASLLLLQQQQNLCSLYPNKPHTNTQNHHRNPNFHSQSLHFQPQKDAISSLLHRISTLESSLNQFLTTKTRSFSSYSVRDTAARVIQTHFRVFLVHRSRTLRDLKELAFIKSSFNSLHSSVLKKTHFDFESVSREAMDLLFKLDSIQGSDPVIRDGKRSVSRDLVRFLDYIDGFNVKRPGLSRKDAKVARIVGNGNKCMSSVVKRRCSDLSGNQKETWEKLRGRVEKLRGRLEAYEKDVEDLELEGVQQFMNDGDDDEDEEDKDEEEDGYGVVANKGRNGFSRARSWIVAKGRGVQPRVKKTVSFAKNGNVYNVFDNSGDQVSSGDASSNGSIASDDEHGEAKNYCHVVGESNRGTKGTNNDEGANSENGGCPLNADDDRNPRRKFRDNAGHHNDGNLFFSAPVPVQMETRADLVKKR